MRKTPRFVLGNVAGIITQRRQRVPNATMGTLEVGRWIFR